MKPFWPGFPELDEVLASHYPDGKERRAMAEYVTDLLLQTAAHRILTEAALLRQTKAAAQAEGATASKH